MSAIDPLEVLRKRAGDLDYLLEQYTKEIEKTKIERTSLMVAIAALEAREAKESSR